MASIFIDLEHKYNFEASSWCVLISQTASCHHVFFPEPSHCRKSVAFVVACRTFLFLKRVGTYALYVRLSSVLWLRRLLNGAQGPISWTFWECCLVCSLEPSQICKNPANASPMTSYDSVLTYIPSAGIPRSTDRAGALCGPDVQVQETSTAASQTPIKLLLALASQFKIASTWPPGPFRTRHKTSLTNVQDGPVMHEISE